jgi:hypothetical protein
MTVPHDSRRSRRAALCILHSAFCIALISCAPRAPITLPTDPGTPFPDFTAVHARLSTACAGVRNLQMEMRLSGSAGDEKLGGTVFAGFERPASMRLEGVPPIGGAVFILAARGGSATLLMTRSKEIIRNAPPEAILEAMTGVALAPADLLSVLTGCVLPDAKPISGTLHQGNRAAIEIEAAAQPGAARPTATLFLRQARGEWQLEAARRDRWQVEYTYGAGQFPESVRLISTTPRVNLRAALSQFEVNTGIDQAAFAVVEPKDVTTFTIDDLRRAGPLRGQ